ncbi:hypothetical protein, partial [Salmonella sp. s58078]|uniref:hypothetical protein n=2 Tax=unclassified Salmonella TaxID=2614656 RepID=UPI0039814AFC
AMLLLGICFIIALFIAPQVAARQLAQTSTNKPKATKTNGLNDAKYAGSRDHQYTGPAGIGWYPGHGR